MIILYKNVWVHKICKNNSFLFFFPPFLLFPSHLNFLHPSSYEVWTTNIPKSELGTVVENLFLQSCERKKEKKFIEIISLSEKLLLRALVPTIQEAKDLVQELMKALLAIWIFPQIFTFSDYGEIISKTKLESDSWMKTRRILVNAGHLKENIPGMQQ